MKPTDKAPGSSRGAEGAPKHDSPKKAPSGWKAKFDKITKGVKDFARGLLKSVSEGFSAGKKAAEGSKPSNKPVESEKGQAPEFVIGTPGSRF